ncbi:MAG: RNA pseudouridine synthase [Bacteroidia bacterium]|nr:RNA pseudouridine synthase [Bacteroidia bacterium]
MNDLQVLYEDNHIIVVNKRPGEIVQSDKTGDKPLVEIVKEYIGKKYNKPGNVFMGVVHRIDRPVSGIVIFSRTSKSLSRMNEIFREKKVNKGYWAIVRNRPSEAKGTLIHYLKRDPEKNKVKAFPSEEPGSQRSWLDYEVIGQSDNYYLLDVHPHTGRHHQIRAQLAAMGCPIKGDVKYGAERTNEGGLIHLHARTIRFLHPVKKENIEIQAEPPDETLWNYFKEHHV